MGKRYAVGLMSGTSLDGVDAALVSFDEHDHMTLEAFETYDMSEELKERLLSAMDIHTSNVAELCSLNYEMGYVFANAVKNVCMKGNFNYSDLEFVASHGQTMYHMPHENRTFYKSTLQIGEPSVIAYEVGVKVVSNFRGKDMAAGGEGAPLVPYFDYAYFKNKSKHVCLLNIGGISNVTIIPRHADLDEVIAFDTGPGNMIINEVMSFFYGLPYDDKGELGLHGHVNDKLLNELMNDPFITLPPPKSTGREKYGKQFVLNLIKATQLKPEDIVATVTAFTAASILKGIEAYDVDEIIVSGGGVYNLGIMNRLKEKYVVFTSTEKGVDADAKEAMAFALLGYEAINNKTANVPNATGADAHVSLGSITYP